LTLDVITMNLKAAFTEPGCPICRLRQQEERRHLFRLLYENVNDGGTRQRLVQSLGLCLDHAWLLQATEQSTWGDGLGVGIIYEHLTTMVANTLCEYVVQRRPFWRRVGRTSSLAGLHRWLVQGGRAFRSLTRRQSPPGPGASLSARLSPAARCHVCRTLDDSERTHLKWLVRGVGDAKFRDWYAASDGLCLPHLRRALAYVKDEEAVAFLVEVAKAKLKPLLADLREYLRKRDWNNRSEPKHPWEQASWVRAVAFLTGEAKEGQNDSVYRLRREALVCYRQRLSGAAGGDARSQSSTELQAAGAEAEPRACYALGPEYDILGA